MGEFGEIQKVYDAVATSWGDIYQRFVQQPALCDSYEVFGINSSVSVEVGQ